MQMHAMKCKLTLLQSGPVTTVDRTPLKLSVCRRPDLAGRSDAPATAVEIKKTSGQRRTGWVAPLGALPGQAGQLPKLYPTRDPSEQNRTV